MVLLFPEVFPELPSLECARMAKEFIPYASSTLLGI